ncbi:hypothetical protein [Asticcacaulis endophyticus]|uniref:Uncharacterized protein n=1 Tax=Asticcacaulis endophyticus TaxID=1395890 RepID=A0A918UN60_9CAUL|nr:hypothetical protein [Asticcacaulis endophyticus]GGZ22014.1 hypothetical protein GCM10011273_03530 [Asticcacaulis endophyticus]
MTEYTHKRAIKWLLSDDVGTSSKALLSAGLGLDQTYYSYPSDGGDFGRCVRLLINVPEVKSGFSILAEKSPYWKALIERWDDIEVAYIKALETRDGAELYKLMRSILKPIEDADRNVTRIGEGVRIRTST